jgi:hypothetical protein
VILRAAAGTLDLSRPVAVMLVGVLHLIQDSEDPYRIVAGLMDALPSGSYVPPAGGVSAYGGVARKP